MDGGAISALSVDQLVHGRRVEEAGAADPDRSEVPVFDPAAHRAGGAIEHRGDVGSR